MTGRPESEQRTSMGQRTAGASCRAPRRPTDHEASRAVAVEMVRDTVAAVRAASARRRAAMAPPVPTDDEPDAASSEVVRSQAQLRAAITVLVCRLRDGGAPIERLVPEVKSLVRDAAVAEPWAEPNDGLVEQAIRWTVEAYYDQPELRGSPGFY